MTAPLLPDCAQTHRTGLSDAVLREIAGHLERLASDPAFEETIDLRSLPMTGRDREELLERLGLGEVEAVLNLAGETRIAETAHAGVWHIHHMGARNKTASEQIVVTLVPEILKAHPADVAIAAASLRGSITAHTDLTDSASGAAGNAASQTVQLQGERS